MPNELAQRILGMPGASALSVLVILAAFLSAAAWSDLRYQRIPNPLVFPGALLALVLHTVLPAGNGFLSDLPGGLGFLGALKGLALGLLAWLPFYLLGAMRAGDVKLLAMVGAFLGPTEIWWALFFTLLAGGALAFIVALRSAAVGAVLRNLRLMFMGLLYAIGTGKSRAESGHDFVSAARLPYGVAIATGSIASVLYRGRLFNMF